VFKTPPDDSIFYDIPSVSRSCNTCLQPSRFLFFIFTANQLDSCHSASQLADKVMNMQYDVAGSNLVRVKINR